MFALGPLACGEEPLSPASTNLDGLWGWSANNLSGSTTAGVEVVCNASRTLNLLLFGESLSGTADAGTLLCHTLSPPTSEPTVPELIANGLVRDGNLRFDFGDELMHHEGTYSGSSTSGTLNYQLNARFGAVVLTGSWRAVRQLGT